MVRLGHFALALAETPHAVRLLPGTDKPPPWLRLFDSAAQQQLMAMMATVDADTAGGEVRSLWCGSGASVPRYPAVGAWCVLLEQTQRLDPKVAERYERVFALVGQEASPTCWPAVAAVAPQDATASGNDLLVIGTGSAPYDAACLRQLRAAGAVVRHFNPYAAGVDLAGRQQLYSRCRAVVVAAAEITSDDYFFAEALAAGLTPLHAWLPDTPPVWSDTLWQQAADAFTRGVPARQVPTPAWLLWEQVARRCLAAHSALVIPSAAQLNRLVAGTRAAAQAPTVLLQTPTRPLSWVPSAGQVGFTVAAG